MKKYVIWMDERYPEYGINLQKYKYQLKDSVEIPKDKLEWVEEVTRDWEEVQSYLSGLRHNRTK